MIAKRQAINGSLGDSSTMMKFAHINGEEAVAVGSISRTLPHQCKVKGLWELGEISFQPSMKANSGVGSV